MFSHTHTHRGDWFRRFLVQNLQNLASFVQWGRKEEKWEIGGKMFTRNNREAQITTQSILFSIEDPVPPLFCVSIDNLNLDSSLIMNPSDLPLLSRWPSVYMNDKTISCNKMDSSLSQIMLTTHIVVTTVLNIVLHLQNFHILCPNQPIKLQWHITNF